MISCTVLVSDNHILRSCIWPMVCWLSDLRFTKYCLLIGVFLYQSWYVQCVHGQIALKLAAFCTFPKAAGNLSLHKGVRGHTFLVV